MMVVREMRVRRRDSRIWFLLLGVFAMVFLFTFLTWYSGKNKMGVEAASLDGFDPGYIISDWQMGNYTSMSEADIQAFLTMKNPCRNRDYNYYLLLSANTNYKWHWKDDHFVCLSEELFGDGENIGEGETAARIIWQTAQDYHINPQVILVLLQKETGLITDPIPNNGDYRKATGYGCPDTAPCSSQYYGFKNQVRKAAALFRTVLDGGWTNYPLGENYIQYNPSWECGGSVVNVRSLATSALYRYTPYQPNEGALAAGYGTAYCGAYGNRNFYLYFEDWFGGIVASESIVAPSNVKAEKGNNQITISWSAPSNVGLYSGVQYEVVLADSDKNELKIVVDGNTYSYSFNVDKGRYIAASVKAFTYNSSAYDRITFDYSFGDLPDKPTDLKAELYNGGIKVSWKKPVNTGGLPIDKYEAVIADEQKNEIKVEVEGDKEEVVFYGLKMGKYFAASVNAFNAVGGRWSRIVFSIRTFADALVSNNTYEGFRDLPNDEISKEAVSWAVQNGITDKNDYFNGEKSLTRRQAVVMLWRLAGKPDATAYEGFRDLPSDEVSRVAVSFAVYNEITDKNDYFNGENSLTRRQAVVMLWRLAGKPETTVYKGFRDLPSDEVSKKAISWAVENGITDKNDYFNGESSLTRRQAVVILKRFYSYLEENS